MVSSLEKGEERLALHALLCQFIGDPQWGEEGRKRHRDSAYVAYASSP